MHRDPNPGVRPSKLEVDLKEVEDWAESLYGLNVQARELHGEIDCNFLLVSPDGTRRVLKVAPPEVDSDSLDCQMAVLEHLEGAAMGETIPRLIRDRDGNRCSRHSTRAGRQGTVRLLSYLPGRPLAEVEDRSPGLERQIGVFLGRLDTALLDFDHPGAHREFFWDLTRILDLRPYLEWTTRSLRTLIAHHLDRFARRVAPRLAELPRSVIHNDANDHNLLVSGGEQLTGLIDFGDMLHTVTACEIAIASTYLMLESSCPERTAERVLDGYTTVRALSALERELVPDLILGRLCNSLLMSAQAQHLAPENEYLRISEQPSIDLLERLTP